MDFQSAGQDTLRSSTPAARPRISWSSACVPATRAAFARAGQRVPGRAGRYLLPEPPRSTAPSSPWPAHEPVETCFCGTFGIDAANPDGDVYCLEGGRRAVPGSQDRKGRKADGGADCRSPKKRTKSAVEEQKAAHQRAHGQAAAGQSPDRRFRQGQDRASSSTLPSGRSCPSPAWAAAPAPSSAPPASATTSGISTPATACSASAAGTAACTPTSPRCPPVSPV